MKKLIAGSLITFAVLNHAIAETNPLAGYGATLEQTSVSGLSSGAFMTAQFHIANSSQLIGAGIIAGGPFYCAGSYESNTYLENATTTCMMPLMESVGPDVDSLLEKAKEFAATGEIDPLKDVLNDQVYIFTGQSDKTVYPTVVKKTLEFYQKLGVSEQQIKFNDQVDAGHSIITDVDIDVPCAETRAPYINDCDFMQSHRILRHIYGELNPPTEPYQLSGKFVKFDQSEFIESDRTSMDETAFAYVPASCDSKACRIHIAFHGCEQGFAVIHDEYFTETGYNTLADTNDIIVLYPQVKPSPDIPYNPKGCWDFWGYSSSDAKNPNFYSRTAPQIAAVMKMVQRLAEPRQTANAQ